MYPNQPPQVYTTRHYNYNAPARPQPPPYPYYSNNSYNAPPTTVTYLNDRMPTNPSPNYSSYYPPNPTTNYSSYAPPNPPSNNYSSYVPPSPQRYATNSVNNNPPMRPNPSVGAGGIEKTNIMSDGNPFYDPGRRYDPPMNSSRTVTSVTAQPKSGGPVNKTLNLSDENPFHDVYGGYHYPSSIDPSKRITTQAAAARSTDNKSLNLSDENPFFDTYGRYHYPSQIDPSKRITEMPKQAGPLAPTNETSEENPFNYRAPPPPPVQRQYPSYPADDWSQNAPAPLSYRPIQVQRPAEPYYGGGREPSPTRQVSPPPAARAQPQRSNPPSGPLDKTSLNMSPDNPFADTHGKYYYPSGEEIKAQKRMNAQNNRFGNDSRPSGGPAQPPPPPPSNSMTEYPEPEKKEIMAGKGNTKFSRFDVNF